MKRDELPSAPMPDTAGDLTTETHEQRRNGVPGTTIQRLRRFRSGAIDVTGRCVIRSTRGFADTVRRYYSARLHANQSQRPLRVSIGALCGIV